jgi:hypothetical protein
MLPLWRAQTQVQTTPNGQQCGRMLYNEREQGGILSGVRFGLALLAYTDILLCSIWAIHRIRQSPVKSSKIHWINTTEQWGTIFIEATGTNGGWLIPLNDTFRPLIFSIACLAASQNRQIRVRYLSYDGSSFHGAEVLGIE